MEARSSPRRQLRCDGLRLTCRQAQIILVSLEHKARQVLLVEGHIPAHSDILAPLRLLHHAIVLGLQLYQWPKHVLVSICVIIPAQQCRTSLLVWGAMRTPITVLLPCNPHIITVQMAWSLLSEDERAAAALWSAHIRDEGWQPHGSWSASCLRATVGGSSSSPGFCRSSMVAAGFSRQASSRAEIWPSDRCRARRISCMR